MLNRFLLAGCILFISLVVAKTQQVPSLGPPTGIACAYNATPQVITSGQAGWVQCDVGGNIVVTASPTALQQVVGNVASGAADTGNPVKIGGRYNATQPTLTDGQRGDIQLDTRANQRVVIMNIDGVSGAAVTAAGTDGVASQSGLWINNQPRWFNGSTFDRQFTCATSSPVGVNAATQQILPLSGSTVIRVCSVIGTISPTGSISFFSGTGGTCGSGTSILTPAISLAAGTPIHLANSMGSVFRSGAGHNLCVTVSGGTFNGVITYAQY